MLARGSPLVDAVANVVAGQSAGNAANDGAGDGAGNGTDRAAHGDADGGTLHGAATAPAAAQPRVEISSNMFFTSFHLPKAHGKGAVKA
mgnify:CR=1 FL=1